jgi:N6-adenosine-specific RNA methylase IME4
MSRYGVILADPPWAYRNGGCRGCAAGQYPVMTDAEICALPVVDIAAPDCVLLLWTTWPKLAEGLAVMAAWGFKYVTGFPWIKVTDVHRTLWGDIAVSVPFGVGFWARGTSEPLLIGRRGQAKAPGRDFVGLLCPNVRHSRKPENVYEYAEALPGPYVELFARRARDGWDVWGNEVEGTDLFAAPAQEQAE